MDLQLAAANNTANPVLATANAHNAKVLEADLSPSTCLVQHWFFVRSRRSTIRTFVQPNLCSSMLLRRATPPSLFRRPLSKHRGLSSRVRAVPASSTLNRFGWAWQADASCDENYLDLAFLLGNFQWPCHLLPSPCARSTDTSPLRDTFCDKGAAA